MQTRRYLEGFLLSETVLSTVDAAATADVSFASFDLPRPIVTALTRNGITTPLPIQTATLPDAIAGRDILGRGQTGSGKTLAFGLPLLARLTGRTAAPHRPLAVVLVPTRELAAQVHRALEPLGRGLCIRMKTAVGGTPINRQIQALRRGVEVLVATPGRLSDLVERRSCDLSDVSVVVLDEADQMADFGFLPAVSALLERMPATGQRMLFSATLDNDVDALVRRFLTDPVNHAVAPPVATVDTMTHHLLHVPQSDKFAVTAAIANRDDRTIMFVRTRHSVDKLVAALSEIGVPAAALHGGLSQGMRTRTLGRFREGKIPTLVATDVAARGIHVEGISLVVHVDPSEDAKSYVHRAGRTARAGASGTVVTLVLPNQRRSVTATVRQAGVRPTEHRPHAHDPELARLTGARPPDGLPAGGTVRTSGGAGAKPGSGYRAAKPRGAGKRHTVVATYGAPKAGRYGKPRHRAPRA